MYGANLSPRNRVNPSRFSTTSDLEQRVEVVREKKPHLLKMWTRFQVPKQHIHSQKDLKGSEVM